MDGYILCVCVCKCTTCNILSEKLFQISHINCLHFWLLFASNRIACLQFSQNNSIWFDSLLVTFDSWLLFVYLFGFFFLVLHWCELFYIRMCVFLLFRFNYNITIIFFCVFFFGFSYFLQTRYYFHCWLGQILVCFNSSRVNRVEIKTRERKNIKLNFQYFHNSFECGVVWRGVMLKCY